jgi:aspartyl-tRNA(Asn)/glutamyl-tRNA(Gln) amidotransferase subunit A
LYGTAWRTIRFWQHASLTTPFNVTGGPALAQCMGFTTEDLPLSLQIVGRPFDEATVLRAAYACKHGALVVFRYTSPSDD